MIRDKPSPKVKWLAIGVSVFWLLAISYQQYVAFELPQHQLSARTSSQTEGCTGSFSQRYDCKSAIRRSAQSWGFGFWMGRILIIAGPPILLAAIYNWIARRMSQRAEVERRHKYAQARQKQSLEAAKHLEEEAEELPDAKYPARTPS